MRNNEKKNKLTPTKKKKKKKITPKPKREGKKTKTKTFVLDKNDLRSFVLNSTFLQEFLELNL